MRRAIIEIDMAFLAEAFAHLEGEDLKIESLVHNALYNKVFLAVEGDRLPAVCETERYFVRPLFVKETDKDGTSRVYLAEIALGPAEGDARYERVKRIIARFSLDVWCGGA